jgi:diaminohydroxyphosphoribosylaminopyrimidine deaminase/5-amino-6-(5-phosphoribosylamino)uracil reductase
VDDLRYMREALQLAEMGRGFVSPNPMVGCVIVRNARIVGRGYHRRYGECHAEVAAITDAGRRARGGTMYVTLQPCNHFGKTPPCSDAAIRSGVKRLVIAAMDPNPKTLCDAGLQKLRAAGIRISTGLLEPEARRQNEVYFHGLKYHRPFVALKLAATLDGMIADTKGRSQWISGPESRDRVQQLRAEYDAVLVGAGTVRADNPRLTCRLPGRRHPLRVILDDELITSPRTRLLSRPGRTIIFCARRVSAPRRQRLASHRVEVIPVRENPKGRLAWTDVLDQLHQRNVASLLIEGGAEVASSALKAGIVSKLYLFMAPRILGKGKSFSAGLGEQSLHRSLRLREWQAAPIGSDLLVQGYLQEE